MTIGLQIMLTISNFVVVMMDPANMSEVDAEAVEATTAVALPLTAPQTQQFLLPLLLYGSDFEYCVVKWCAL